MWDTAAAPADAGGQTRHMVVETRSPHRCCVFAAYDGEQWDSFTVRRMPDRSWGVLHNRGAVIDANLNSGSTDLLAELPTLEDARTWSADVAKDAGVRALADSRAPMDDPSCLRPLAAAEPMPDRSGDPRRIGPIITRGHLTRAASAS